MTRSVLSIALAGALALPAAAQTPVCAPRADLVRTLEQAYGETRRGAGLQSADALFEIFASTETGSWTVLITRTDGTACAVAAGEAWREDRTPANDPPA